MAVIEIDTIEKLVKFGNGEYGRGTSSEYLDVVLTADLDFADLKEHDNPYNWAGCTGTWYINFDGQGHKIDNIYYEGSNAWGFFGTLYGSIKNLRLTNLYVTSLSSYCCGLMCFLGASAIVSNCHIAGNINATNNSSGTPACGICFQRSNGSVIEHCSVSGRIFGTATALGICQNSSGTTYTYNCTIHAELEGRTSDALPFTSQNAIVTNCIFVGTIKAGVTSWVGGYQTTFTNCIFVYKPGSTSNFTNARSSYNNCYYDDTVAQEGGFSLSAWLTPATTEQLQNGTWLNEHNIAN